MRKMLSVCLLAGVAMCGSGCVMIIGAHHPGCTEQVVVVDGEFRAVNMKTHKVRKFKVQPVEQSETVTTQKSSGG